VLSPRFLLLSCSIVFAVLVSGCKVTYAPPPRSIEHGRSAAIASIARSPEIAEWLAEKPLVSILPMRSPNGHVMTVGDVVLNDLEQWLVARQATVVSRERQQQMICEVARQGGTPFDQRFTAKLGRQLGTKWFVTGTVTPVSRYWSFHPPTPGWTDRSTIHVKIIDAETSRILWEDRLPLVDHQSEHVAPSGEEKAGPGWEEAVASSALTECPPSQTRGASTPPAAPEAELPPFDGTSATLQLSKAAYDVRSCDHGDAPNRRSGLALVTFANDGSVERVELEDAWASRATGACVAARLSNVTVAPFRGPKPKLGQRFSF
jgi:hypothetical protein